MPNRRPDRSGLRRIVSPSTTSPVARYGIPGLLAAEGVGLARGRGLSSRNPVGGLSSWKPGGGLDRKRVGTGKSVSVRVDLGGSRIINTNINYNDSRDKNYRSITN